MTMSCLPNLKTVIKFHNDTGFCFCLEILHPCTRLSPCQAKNVKILEIFTI